MFRTFSKRFLPNPFDRMLKKCAKRGGKKVLLQWNRGLGDIALGLYAMVQRIYELVPDAKVFLLTRPNLHDGFCLLKNIEILIDPDMKRGEKNDAKRSLRKLGIDPASFDLIIENPSPTDWVYWQRGKVVPRLQMSLDENWKRFDLPNGFTYVGLQAVIETTYGLWRNWPLKNWKELIARLDALPNVKMILFGAEDRTEFHGKNVIDLRGKTTLFEMLSIIKNRCRIMVLPDSGILSLSYYLDEQFPIHVASLWADPNHGILKQAVKSPNLQLLHTPLIGKNRDLSTVSVDAVMNTLFPPKPLQNCPKASEIAKGSWEKAGCIILAGGQGSRLGMKGPKGLFSILGKTLFERLCEKAPRENFPIAIMTSPMNHEETISYFAKQNNFGREIYFFCQEVLPFLDEKMRETSFLAPNGNGSVFSSFLKSGLGNKFQERGIDLVTVVPIENPMADPVDLRLIGHLRKTKSDAVVKCVLREKKEEPMGVLIERKGRIEIVEYTDLDPNLDYVYSNTGMLAFSLPFFLKMGSVDLPLHPMRKKIPGTKKWGWKRERLIFDVLAFANTSALCDEKRVCYAPIKSEESILEAEKLLQ